MKRQRSNDNHPPKEISLQDVWHFFQTTTLTYNQLLDLDQEIDRLYSLSTNAITQNFPSDLWLNIFAASAKPRVSRTLPFVKPSDSKAKRDLKTIRFWLRCRTVSKSWDCAISRMDFSRFIRVPLDKLGPLQPSKLLQYLRFSEVQLDHSKEWVHPSLLTNLTSLNLRIYIEDVGQDEERFYSQLTRLTSLSLYVPGGEGMQSLLHAVLCLTNLQSLQLKHVSLEEPLTSLTNLHTLKLFTPFTVQVGETLTRLKNIETDDQTFFKTGQGICHYGLDSYYQGQWKDGKPHGKGLYCHSAKYQEYYDGDWVEGTKSGHGRTQLGEDSYYEGPMSRGFWAEGGTRVYENSDIYRGAWQPWSELQSVKDGHGVYEFHTGEIYDGQWEEDQLTGKGKCTYANGDLYEGDWVKGYRQGQEGTYTWADGSKVTGTWFSNFLLGVKSSSWGALTPEERNALNDRITKALKPCAEADENHDV